MGVTMVIMFKSMVIHGQNYVGIALVTPALSLEVVKKCRTTYAIFTSIS